VARRNPDIQAQYSAYRRRLREQQIACQFCAEIAEPNIVADLPTMLVIKNIFPYENWDGGPVADHLMIVPKRHSVSLTDLTEAEQGDYLAACALFESRGYNVYTRASSNPIRTVEHLHTHLITTAFD